MKTQESDQGTPELNETDHALLAYPDSTLATGAALARWWQQKYRSGVYGKRFGVMREYVEGDRDFGFFDSAPVGPGGSDLPVMGILQEMFYDRPRQTTGSAIQVQMREFILRYFMRVSHQRLPIAATVGPPPASSLERSLSWLPDGTLRQVGFGYQQLYYKRHDSGAVGKFREEDRNEIVDLRDIGTVYDWIVVKVTVFNFNISLAPLGGDGFKVQQPLDEESYLVIGPPFITNWNNPESGVLGENRDNPEPVVLGDYGFGYAFLPYSVPSDPGKDEGIQGALKKRIAYGPGKFTAAIQTFNFRVMETGEVRVRAVFVVNRPDKIATVDIAPVDWGFSLADMMTFNMASMVMGPVKMLADRLPLRINGVDPIQTYIWLANIVSGGMAAERFGMSLETLEKFMLFQHFNQHNEMLTNSVLVWRQIPDWTAHAHLPAFVRHGASYP